MLGGKGGCKKLLLVSNILHCKKRHKETPEQVNGDYSQPPFSQSDPVVNKFNMWVLKAGCGESIKDSVLGVSVLGGSVF